MPHKNIPSLRSVALTALRRAKGWTEQDLAESAGISRRAVSLYEIEREPSPERLRTFAEAMGYEPDAPDFVLAGLTQAVDLPEGPRSPCDPSPQETRAARLAAVKAGQASAELIEHTLLDQLRRRNARRDREEAADLVQRLEAVPRKERLRFLESRPDLQTWAVAERLCDRSTEAASDRADLALELAGLARRCAELAPGEDLWRARLEGYVHFFVANARRVANREGAEEAFARGVELWEAGAPADLAGLLPEWRRFDLEGSLRRDQRRFPEALEALERARAVAPQEAEGRILLKEAFTLEQMGEVERVAEVLREAAPLVDDRLEPRLWFGIRFTWVSALCHLGRFAEGQELLPNLRDMAVASRKELDLLRVVWLDAKVASGLGRKEEAQALFEQVRREFITREMTYDYALVTLELIILLLEQGRNTQVQTLAAESLWSFQAHGIRRESLAALEVFCAATGREEISLDLARQLLADLRRALKKDL